MNLKNKNISIEKNYYKTSLGFRIQIWSKIKTSNVCIIEALQSICQHLITISTIYIANTTDDSTLNQPLTKIH